MDRKQLKITIKPSEASIEEHCNSIIRSTPILLTLACTESNRLQIVHFLSAYKGDNNLNMLNMSNLDEAFEVELPSSGEHKEIISRIVNTGISFIEERPDSDRLEINHAEVEFIFNNAELTRIIKNWIHTLSINF